jgi:hypothetical protein
MTALHDAGRAARRPVPIQKRHRSQIGTGHHEHQAGSGNDGLAAIITVTFTVTLAGRQTGTRTPDDRRVSPALRGVTS